MTDLFHRRPQGYREWRELLWLVHREIGNWTMMRDAIRLGRGRHPSVPDVFHKDTSVFLRNIWILSRRAWRINDEPAERKLLCPDCGRTWPQNYDAACCDCGYPIDSMFLEQPEKDELDA